MSPPAEPSTSDRALLASLAAWSGVEALALLGRFGRSKARRLASQLAEAPPLDAIRALHRIQIHPDPARIHDSWFVRALADQADSVRRAVARRLEPPLREVVVKAFGLTPDHLEPDCEPDPEIVAVAAALWTERLVGDAPPTRTDPPVVRALASLSPLELGRLLRACGVAKRIVADGVTPEKAGRHAELAAAIEPPDDARLVVIAGNDVAGAAELGRHALAGLGLVTLARTSTGKDVDAYRLRWALQHVPYPVARRFRNLASQPAASSRAVRHWERGLLAAAAGWLRSRGSATIEVSLPDDPETAPG